LSCVLSLELKKPSSVFQRVNNYYSLKLPSSLLLDFVIPDIEEQGDGTNYLLSFTPGWTNFEENVFGKAQIYKLGQLCVFQGAVSTSQQSGDQPIHFATLPIQCRPSTVHCFFFINIYPTGDMYCLPQKESKFISLCGITFVSQN